MISKQIKYLVSFTVYCLLSFNNFSQPNPQNIPSLNYLLIQETFSSNLPESNAKRIPLSLKDSKLVVKLNPLTYVAVGLMYFYQNVLSEQISANCNYQISCSEYTKKCIERYGLIKGTLHGLNQLSRCIPNVQHEYSEYLISDQNKIINAIE